MKIVSLSITNYRSITKTDKLPLEDLTVLIGPNNEGKSNILRGLVLALTILSRGAIYLGGRLGIRLKYDFGRKSIDYRWSRDFPVKLQSTNPKGETEFALEFELNEIEKTEFKKQVQSNLKGRLPLRLKLGPDSAKFEVPVKGPGQKKLSQKKDLIANFIRGCLDYQYIPPIRTSALTVDIIEDLLSREMSVLQNKPEYKKILEDLTMLQKPILDTLSEKLTQSVKAFIPDVQKIELDTKARLDRAFRSSCRVLVDDGSMTDLELKGDGIKSLTAISLIRHSTISSSAGKGLILAIEEPEAHLHPKAIHQLRIVLNELAQSHQVVLTTHSPLLVAREKASRNLIVNATKAFPAISLSEVRDSIGVKTSDNLISASLVLLVEGEEDVKIIRTWLQASSSKIQSAIQNGSLIFDYLQGGTNVSYKASLYKNLLCMVHAFLDNDETGVQSAEKALNDGVLDSDEYNLANVIGMKESEIEDLVEVSSYRARVEAAYGINLGTQEFRNNKQKWSDRIKAVFQTQGKLWNKSIEQKVKSDIADSVVAAGISSLSQPKKSTISALITSIEKRLTPK